MDNPISALFEKIPTLYVIGNGFDLAHGIKSSYKDFKKWLLENKNNHLVDMLDVFFSHDYDVWNGIEQALGSYDEDSILDYCRPDEEFDFDHSLSSAARVEDSPMAIFQPVINEFKEVFTDWVNSIEITNAEKIYTLDADSRYLTFNYTETLEMVYGIPKDNICHIHGSRLAHSEYVVGHNNSRDAKDVWGDDEIIFEQQAKENIITWMNDFTKDYDGNIGKNQAFFDSTRGVKQIITYGHSLNEIDWPYFDEIIRMTGNDAKWIIHAFSPNDRTHAIMFQKHFGLTNLSVIGAE